MWLETMPGGVLLQRSDSQEDAFGIQKENRQSSNKGGGRGQKRQGRENGLYHTADRRGDYQKQVPIPSGGLQM